MAESASKARIEPYGFGIILDGALILAARCTEATVVIARERITKVPSDGLRVIGEGAVAIARALASESANHQRDRVAGVAPYGLAPVQDGAIRPVVGSDS